MRRTPFRVFCVAVPTLLVLAGVGRFVRPVGAQNQEMQERVAEIKQAAAQNKQALAQYTWVEQVTVGLKGEQKKQEHFQVRLGPDGKPQKESLDPPPEPPKHEGRLKKHIVEKKKEEYKEYADQIKELIRQYVPPERDMLEQAYQKGNIMLGPQPGTSGQYRLVISNYIKQGDNLTLVVDKTQTELLSLSIATSGRPQRCGQCDSCFRSNSWRAEPRVWRTDQRREQAIGHRHSKQQPPASLSH